MNVTDFKEQFNLIEYVNNNFEVELRGDKTYILCPFHSEGTNSCLIGPTRYYCFGCGAKGSSIDFIMQHTGMSFHEVMTTDFSSYIGPAIERQRIVERKAAPLSMGLVQSYAKNLQNNPARKDYLLSRHFTDNSIIKSHIGWGIPLDLHGAKFNSPRYSIPHFNAAGELSGMRYRIDPRFEQREIKYLAHPGTKGQIYNVHVLNKYTNILYCGSQLDAAALYFGYKIPAVAPPSENTWNPEWHSLFYNKRVLIMLDNDNTGEVSSIKVYKALRNSASLAKIFVWPHEFKPKDDTKDYIDKYGIEGIQNIMREHLE